MKKILLITLMLLSLNNTIHSLSTNDIPLLNSVKNIINKNAFPAFLTISMPFFINYSFQKIDMLNIVFVAFFALKIIRNSNENYSLSDTEILILSVPLIFEMIKYYKHRKMKFLFLMLGLPI